MLSHRLLFVFISVTIFFLPDISLGQEFIQTVVEKHINSSEAK